MAYDHDEIETGKATGWWKSLAVITCLCFVCVEVWAAAALALDPESGVTGHGIGVDEATASAAAIADCASNGSDNPEFWFGNENGGWGAVAFSDEGGGAWWLGGSLGYNKKKKAKRVAKRECRDSGGTNCQIVDLFEDTIGKAGGEKGKNRGSSFSASSN
ncbi:MAG: DUF4189 domain-containing protein [Candidatus Hydrogenedentes bacterium]|nr:DUF4189 domain-containing protein [Candidatus Hydrogenedentota bacterium]